MYCDNNRETVCLCVCVYMKDTVLSVECLYISFSYLSCQYCNDYRHDYNNKGLFSYHRLMYLITGSLCVCVCVCGMCSVKMMSGGGGFYNYIIFSYSQLIVIVYSVL